MGYREVLVAPDGRTVNVTSPVEYNDLRYGQGYRLPSQVQPADEEPERTGSNPDVEPERVEEPEGSIREDDAY